MSSDLFLRAFAGDPESNSQRPEDRSPASPDQRGDLFTKAFGRPAAKEMPTPHLGTTFRWDMTKVSKLSFEEKMTLDQYEGQSYRTLPAWLIDGGYAIPSESEKKHQRDALRETGLTQSERNVVFDQHLADVEALAAMAESEILRDSAVLDGEFKRIADRYSAEEVMASLAEINPEAAQYLSARQQVLAAEAKAAEIAQRQSAAEKEEATRQELQAAAEAIAAMKDDVTPGDLLARDQVLRNAEK